MSYLVDLIIILISLITVIISAKKGFVATVTKAVGFILAFVVAMNLGAYLSDFTYDKIIEPSLVETTVSAISDTVEDTSKNVFEALPSFIGENLDKFGISKDSLSFTSADSKAKIEKAVSDISRENIKPVVSNLLSILFTVIIFVILLIVVKFLSKFINKLFSFSIVGKLNRFLGGLLGLPLGVVYSFLFCIIIKLVVSITENGFLIFTPENVNNSYVFKFFTEIIPFN